jgi:hypothetical protein
VVFRHFGDYTDVFILRKKEKHKQIGVCLWAMNEDILLIIPDKADAERDVLAQKWSEQYGDVMKIGKFWVKPETNGKNVALYGYDSFCLVLAQILNLQMVSPNDEVIGHIDARWTKRQIEIRALAEIDQIQFPIFIKPVTPKLFKGKVYASAEEVKAATMDIKPVEKIIVSEIVPVEKEVRVFVLAQEIQDLAFYEGSGDVEEVRIFAQNCLADIDRFLPNTYVLDLGYNSQIGWFVVEFNSSWGAGLNFCAPEKVLACIKAATINP